MVYSKFASKFTVHQSANELCISAKEPYTSETTLADFWRIFTWKPGGAIRFSTLLKSSRTDPPAPAKIHMTLSVTTECWISAKYPQMNSVYPQKSPIHPKPPTLAVMHITLSVSTEPYISAKELSIPAKKLHLFAKKFNLPAKELNRSARAQKIHQKHQVRKRAQ